LLGPGARGEAARAASDLALLDLHLEIREQRSQVLDRRVLELAVLDHQLLLLVDEQDAPLTLTNGRFCLRREDVVRGRDHFIRWYTDHARAWLEPRMTAAAQRVGVAPTGLEIRDLGFRWGSCSPGGTVNFHWATIRLPPTIIEYVLVHELVHLHEPNHMPDFWHRLKRAMPDYRARKQWLAEHGGRISVL
jgi:hypothetical protein